MNNKITTFRDAPFAPELTLIPAGKFLMGSPEDEAGRQSESLPHEVTIAEPFAIGIHTVTFEQFSYFIDNSDYEIPDGAVTVEAWGDDEERWERPYMTKTAHDYEDHEYHFRKNRSFQNPGFKQDKNAPVVCVSWHDAKAYTAWLSEVTGFNYSLPSEQQWEYAARAGTTTPYWWGESITTSQANYDGYTYDNGKGQYHKKTVPVHHFKPNPWGLYNVHGNIWEWCKDRCEPYFPPNLDFIEREENRYKNAPVMRGGSWYSAPKDVRSASRILLVDPNSRGSTNGFRVCRNIIP